MSALEQFTALSHLLPESRIGTVTAIEPISMGLSGAGVYAVTSDQGEFVLRVNRADAHPARWSQQLKILQRAAEHGVAPAIVHVDEAERAIVCRRVAGMPLAVALTRPERRDAILASIVEQLRTLHRLDATGIEEQDALAHLRAQHAGQRTRPGFPAWAVALDPVFDAIRATLALDPRRVVSHNDPNPGNILWDGARAWLVDWEVAGLAHPFYDLAVLSVFLRFDEATAHGLLAELEGGPIDARARSTLAALERLAAIFCGCVFLGMVPDLGVLPLPAPTLPEFYADLRAGKLGLADPRGRGAFGLALLSLGVHGSAAR